MPMRTLRWFVYRLTSLVRGRERQRDLDDELQFHLEEETDEQRAAGLDGDDARRAARRSLGNVALIREDTRETWAWCAVERLMQDLRYAVRVLARERSFTATALLTIVLLVGGTTAVFTLVNSVLLQPLPYPQSSRLVRITAVGEGGPALSHDDVERLQTATTSFEAWGLFRPNYGVILDRQSPNPMYAQDMRISPGLFPLLGIKVILGRPLVADDELDANPDVGVISHDLWQTRFGGRADVIGQSFELRQGRTLTVVGVAAHGADVPGNRLSLTSTPIVWNPIRVSQRAGQTMRFATVARLKPGRSVEAAERELAGLGTAAGGGRSFSVVSLLDNVVGDTKRVVWIFFAAVSTVLLIGVANLVSLQLVRNAARERELGVRAALGADRWRLVRQLATESLVLGALGGLIGGLAAKGLVDWTVGTLPPDFPRADEILVDREVWLFVMALSVVVALVVGIVPALRVVRPGLAQRISDGAKSVTVGHRRARIQRVLIAFEAGAALVLLVGAALLAHSLGRLMTEGAGMDERDLWVARGTLPLRYQSPRDSEYWTNALRLVRELPGVERASIVMNDGGPLDGFASQFGRLAAEGGASVNGGFSLSLRNVGPAYFETLGIPILQGRPILDSDLQRGDAVAVINQLAASTMWPGESAMGKHFGHPRLRLTVIGVVPDFKLSRLDGDVSMQMYVPYTLSGLAASAGSAAVLVRARPDAEALGDRLKATLVNLEKDVRADVSTMAQVRWQLVASERFRTTVLAVFALTATFLALVGVFGLVAYAVTQRTREIGLRLALGSRHRGITALMARQAFVPAAIGVVAGIVVAFLSSQVLATFLFGIEPTDPATFISAVGLFLVAAGSACLLPALRALRVDPATVLRHE